MNTTDPCSPWSHAPKRCIKGVLQTEIKRYHLQNEKSLGPSVGTREARGERSASEPRPRKIFWVLTA